MASGVQEALAQGVLKRDRRAAARLMTHLEEGREDAREVMKSLFPHTGKGATESQRIHTA